jgi:hypothetical protein
MPWRRSCLRCTISVPLSSLITTAPSALVVSAFLSRGIYALLEWRWLSLEIIHTCHAIGDARLTYPRRRACWKPGLLHEHARGESTPGVSPTRVSAWGSQIGTLFPWVHQRICHGCMKSHEKGINRRHDVMISYSLSCSITRLGFRQQRSSLQA